MSNPDYSRMCFVAMPFGERKLGSRKVDFDAIYEVIFRNAIKRVKLKNGPTLVPKRADDSLHARDLRHEMVTDLIQARLMLADVSAENTNVGWEIGMRSAYVPRGTVLVHLKGAKVPFDLAGVQITDYTHQPDDVIPEAQARIAKALRETLRFDAIDNPFFVRAQKAARALGTPGHPTELGNLVVDAELAIRKGDLATAIDKYRKAERIQPELAYLPRRRATLLVKDGSVKEAEKEMRKAIKIEPDFPEADRWLSQIKRGQVPRPSYIDYGHVEARGKMIDIKRPKLYDEVTGARFSSDMVTIKLPQYEQIFKKSLKGTKKRSRLKGEMFQGMLDHGAVKKMKIKTTDFSRGGRLGRGGRSGGDFGEGFGG